MSILAWGLCRLLGSPLLPSSPLPLAFGLSPANEGGKESEGGIKGGCVRMGRKSFSSSTAINLILVKGQGVGRASGLSRVVGLGVGL